MLGEVLGTAGSVAGIGLVAGATGVINSELNNTVKSAENKLRERG